MLKIAAFLAVPGALGGLTLLHDPTGGPSVRQGTHLIEVGVTFDEAAVRDILPAGFTPASTFTGGLGLFVDQSGPDAGAAAQGYVWIDVNYRGTARYVVRSFPSAAQPNGAEPNVVTAAYHGPETGNIEVVTGSEAQGGFVVAVEPLPATCRAGLAQATPYVFAQGSRGRIGLTLSPVYTRWCDAKLLALDIGASADDALSRLELLEVNWVGLATPLE
ncbi:MAG TPA: hypothetical protein VM899_04255 [Rubellimicrobium sp.]|jgi:hypothetical protein|nr:hypothetical protein [Rubellimicrobium sp.]